MSQPVIEVYFCSIPQISFDLDPQTPQSLLSPKLESARQFTIDIGFNIPSGGFPLPFSSENYELSVSSYGLIGNAVLTRNGYKRYNSLLTSFYIDPVTMKPVIVYQKPKTCVSSICYYLSDPLSTLIDNPNYHNMNIRLNLTVSKDLGLGVKQTVWTDATGQNVTALTMDSFEVVEMSSSQTNILPLLIIGGIIVFLLVWGSSK